MIKYESALEAVQLTVEYLQLISALPSICVPSGNQDQSPFINCIPFGAQCLTRLKSRADLDLCWWSCC
jgi:hypothetical protein